MSQVRVVAVIGASRSRTKFGNRAVRAYRAEGWKVYPIHLEADEIEGIPALASIQDVPEPVHRATVYLQPEAVLGVLAAIAAKGVGDMYLNPGAESGAAIERARELGIRTVVGCSIVDIGRNPEHPD